MSLASPSQVRVHSCLLDFIPPGPWSPLVGELDPARQLARMPVSSPDGRARTWVKTVRDIAAAVYNDVSVVHQDCWLVQAQPGEDFRIIKLSPTGSGNKWTFGRLAYVLVHPHDLNMRTHAPDPLSPVVHTRALTRSTVSRRMRQRTSPGSVVLMGV